MSFFEPVRVLIPSFFIYFIAMALIAGGTLELLRRKLGWGNWCLGTTATIVVALTLFHVAGVLVTADENRRYSEAQQTRAQPAPGTQAGKQMTLFELKGEFLKTVDAVLQNPAVVTNETKKQLFQQFAPLFPDAQTRAQYGANIQNAYICQLRFYEDALATRLANKVTTGAGWNECLQAEGSFFNRPKLITEEVAKENRKTLESLVSTGKKGAYSDPAKAKQTEEALRKAIQDQTARINVLKLLFSN
jgi:hypothetical protein